MNPIELTEEQKAEIVAALAISEEHTISPQANWGQGGLRGAGAAPVRCTVAVSSEVNNGINPPFVTPSFVVVDHPRHGHIAVSRLEFAALGLPEVEGWDWLG